MLIPLFGTGTQAQAAVLSAQKRVNCYVELPKDPEKGQVTILSMPGLRQIVNLDDYAAAVGAWPGTRPFTGPIRGMQLISTPTDYSYFGPWLAVVRGEWVAQLHNYAGYGGTAVMPGTYIAGSGIITSALGDYTQTKRVDITDDGTGSVFVCNGTTNGAWVRAISSSSFISAGTRWDGSLAGLVSDVDAEPATFCTSIGAKIVVSLKGKKYFRYSTDQSGFDWDALDFETPDASPDGTLRVYNHRGTLMAFGDTSVEFFSLSGDPDAPYAPLRGATIPIGLSAVWSLANVAGDAVFLGRTPNGMHQVVRVSGMTPSIISDQQIDAIFNGYETISDATALSYSFNGHTFYQINFPTENESWALDITTGIWTKMVGPDGGRHPAEFAATIANRVVIGHHTSPILYVLDSDTNSFAGSAMPREVVTRHFFKDFDRVVVDELTVDLDVGVGDNTTTDPQVMLQISKDNGKSWGTELWKSLGKIGETRKRVVWRRLGQGRDWTFRIRVTDPVRVVIAGAAINATPVAG
jgi:hypothetical protein